MDAVKYVMLLDDNGLPCGLCEKLLAHQEGLLHQAFSIFVFNEKDELLMQKRADDKYHSGGLWTNTCCSHHTQTDPVQQGKERLIEEMGFSCDLYPLFTFTYRAELEGGLTEYETDTVLIGRYSGAVSPDPNEADSWEWVNLSELRSRVATNPEKYTVWFRKSFDRVADALNGSVI